jgi:hypothetical protein
MLLQTLGSNAEFVRKFGVSRNIKRIATANLKRQSGLIINRSTADVWVEFNLSPNGLIRAPLTRISVPARGGNLDIPANYTGAIWVRWLNPQAIGSLTIYQYYFQRR